MISVSIVKIWQGEFRRQKFVQQIWVIPWVLMTFLALFLSQGNRVVFHIFPRVYYFDLNMIVLPPNLWYSAIHQLLLLIHPLALLRHILHLFTLLTSIVVYFSFFFPFFYIFFPFSHFLFHILIKLHLPEIGVCAGASEPAEGMPGGREPEPGHGLLAPRQHCSPSLQVPVAH